MTFLLAAIPVALPRAQSASLRDSLLKRVRELYGDAAPPTITFVTLPPELLKAESQAAPPTQTVDGLPAGPGGGRGLPIRYDPFGARPVQTRATEKGDSATGVVITQTGNQVFVDASPCRARIMVFTKPFDRDPGGEATCRDQKLKTETFVQK
jgi:hypothetical protein